MTASPGLPLEGLRVLDFCWAMAGPIATRLLANFGAEVLKVESMRRPDGGRLMPPMVKGGGLSAQFLDANSDKLGISLNMNHPKGRELAKRLVRLCDVVANNLRPGTLDKWGLGYEELVRIRPDIIMLEMPAMGKTGPRARYGGYGPGLQAMAGFNHLTGLPGQPPLSSTIALPDWGPNPLHAVTAVMAALHYRNRTGQGQHIEVAQYESTVCFLGLPLLDYAANGRVGSRNGNRSPDAAPHGVFRCAGDDRWCAIAISTDEEWRRFCDAIGKPALAADPRFASLEGRKEREEELERLVEEWTEARPPEDVMRLLQGAGVAAGIVQNAQDLADRDPQVQFRECYSTLTHPEAGDVVCEQVTIKLSASPGRARVPGPGLGQHNEYVFREFLGLDEEEMNRCHVDGVFD